MENPESGKKFSRRQFLKFTGAASAAAGGAGLGMFGYQAGRDPASYTACEAFEGAFQIDRKRYHVDKPHYKVVGPTSRPDARTEVIFPRYDTLARQWDDEKGVDGLDNYLRDFYKAYPDLLELDLYLLKEIRPKEKADTEKYANQFIISNAWSNAMGAVSPPPIDQPPEISDFPRGEEFGEPTVPLIMKSPEKTSALIKKIAHEFGSTLVGITKLNPDWVYKYPMPGRGFDPDKPVEVPKHWQYAIVVGVPMSWDPLYANPTYGTSYDAYSRSRIVAFRLASFIRQLGYPARPHTPGTNYDLMVPPIVVDAGIGEQGRNSIVVTPELGCNFRPSIITTSLPMKPDKPIEFGVQEFCKTCKICAENCPSGAITYGDKEQIRGYLRYRLNSTKCHNFWYSTLGNLGCRLCVAVCPFTRKSNWLHVNALKGLALDPTGLSHKALTGLQKRLYPGPDPEKYYIPSMGGENATYRKPPWWLRSEDFIEF